MKAKPSTARSTTLNFTGRFDLRSVEYTLTEDAGGGLGFRVCLRELPAVRRKVRDTSKTEIILRFRQVHSYGQQETRRFSFDKAEAQGGVLAGSLPKMADPARLGLEVVVKNALNPEGADRMVAYAARSQPERIDAAPEEERPRPSGLRRAPANRVEKTEAPEGSLIHMRIEPTVSGAFFVALVDGNGAPLAMPTLQVHPAIGLGRMKNDRALQAIVFPEIVRRVITAIALHGCYQDAPWYSAWMGYAATLSPSGDEFDFFTDGERPGDPDLDPNLVEARVAAAVAKYAGDMDLKIANDPTWDLEG